MVAQVEQRMVAQVEQRMVAQVEQEGRGWWHRWSKRAEDGGAGGAGGQRMVAWEEQRWYKGTD